MESITLNVTYKTNKNPKGSDVTSFKILKKDDKYMVICCEKDLERLPGPEVYKRQSTGVDYLVGSNKDYNPEILPLLVVGEGSKTQIAPPGEFKDCVAILNEGREAPYINFENMLFLNLSFDSEGKTISFDKTDKTMLKVSTSIFNDQSYHTETQKTIAQDGRSETDLKVNDIIESAITNMSYQPTAEKIAKAFGAWNRKGRG